MVFASNTTRRVPEGRKFRHSFYSCPFVQIRGQVVVVLFRISNFEIRICSSRCIFRSEEPHRNSWRLASAAFHAGPPTALDLRLERGSYRVSCTLCASFFKKFER